MAANPYQTISVPPGPASQQALYVQALYRNAALQQAYQQQEPDWGTALGQGLSGGIQAGLGQYFGQIDQNTKYDQTWQLEMAKQQAAADAQQRLFQQQLAMDQYRAMQAQLGEQRKIENLGQARTMFEQGMTPVPQPDLVTDTYVGGAEPPVFQGGMEQPPETYASTITTPQPPYRPQMGNVLQGMGPSLAGLVPETTLTEYRKRQETTAPTGIDEATARALTQAREYAPGNPTIARSIMGTTRFGAQDVAAPPAAPKEPKSLLSGQSTIGVLSAIVSARSDSDPVFSDPLAQVYGRTPAEMRANARAAMRSQLGYEQSVKYAEAESAAKVGDIRERQKAADEAKRDFTVITTMLPRIEQAAGKVLMSGEMLAKGVNVARAKLNELGKYPEINELTAMGEAVKGAVTRKVLLETGVLTTFDTTRAQALIPLPTDTLEQALAKTRVLRMFMEAAGTAWEEYQRSGLGLRGMPTEKGVSAFLPQDFWQQASRTAPPALPPSFKQVR